MQQRGDFIWFKWSTETEHGLQARVHLDQRQQEGIGNWILHRWVQRTTRDCVLSKFLYRHHSSDICTVRLSVNKTKTTEVSVKFSCTAKLEPSKARIYCVIRSERVSCDLLGIKARSAMSPYISCDDLTIEKELGSGAYLDFSLSSEIFPSVMGQFSWKRTMSQQLQSRNTTISFHRMTLKHNISSVLVTVVWLPLEKYAAHWTHLFWSIAELVLLRVGSRRENWQKNSNISFVTIVQEECKCAFFLLWERIIILIYTVPSFKRHHPPWFEARQLASCILLHWIGWSKSKIVRFRNIKKLQDK